MSPNRAATFFASTGGGRAIWVGAVAGIASLLLLGGSSPMVAPTGNGPLCPSTHGVYVGAAAPEQVDAFEQWSGRPVGCVEDFLSSKSWEEIAHPEWWITRWASASPRRHLILSVPMLPDSGADLRSGSEGRYDQYFQSLATLLVQEGFGDATIRLGWEFNAGEFPWAIHPADPAASPQAFAAYWRRVVTTMRAVAGSRFTFDWTVNNGDNAVPAEQAYPGDDVVDIVGIDAYDQVWGPDGGQVAGPRDRWKAMSTGAYNLDWWAAFAGSHRKAVAVSEWGAVAGGHGGDDNPYYITHMLTWAKAHDARYEVYFDSEDSRISTGALPHAAQAYKAAVAQD